MGKIDSPETNKDKPISDGISNDHNIKAVEDYLKQKKDGTLHISDFDDLLNECGIDKNSL